VPGYLSPAVQNINEAKTAAGTTRHKCNRFASPEPYSLAHWVLRDLGKIRYRKSRATAIFQRMRCQISTPGVPNPHPSGAKSAPPLLHSQSLAGLITELLRLEQAVCIESVRDLGRHQSDGSKRA
jgi:hypothetical protein